MSRGDREVRGQATVELALVLPFVLGLLLLVVQVGLVLRDQLLVVHAAREGARAAAVAPRLDDARRAAVVATALDARRMSVTLARHGAAPPLVTVTVRYRSPTTVPLVGAMVGDIVVSEAVTMRVEGG